MKTAELTGAALDWAVCEAAGMLKAYPQFRSGKAFLKVWGVAKNTHLHPSTNWSQGGPVIEREGISPKHWGEDWDTPWSAAKTTGHYEGDLHFGSTPLIAAMRCYVASKLGDEIEIPEELQ